MAQSLTQKTKSLLAVSAMATGLIMAQTQVSYADQDIESILAQADLGYGEYLSGECVTCHQQNGSDQGLPSITGLDPEGFIAIMLAYRNKELDNNVMQNVASRLDDEQLGSLAVYFASLPAAD